MYKFYVMYSLLLSLHSLFRWLVLASLICSIYMAYQGRVKRKLFTPQANAIRHWTATIAHVQLFIGMILYFESPVVSLPMPDTGAAILTDHTFFRYVHIFLMVLAVVLITVGSAMAKRLSDDLDKYETILKWFIAALFVIAIAIPWPFSPLAARPYLRGF